MADLRPLSPPPLVHPSDIDQFCVWLDELAGDVAPVHDLVLSMLSRFSRDDREHDILTRRFGIDGRDRATLQEIGDHHGVSRERVRQLVDRSMRRVASRALKSVEDGSARDMLTARYGPDSTADVEPLVRRLTLEACAAETGPLTKHFAVLKLRLAGHGAADTSRLANEVHSRVARVRNRLRTLERVERKAAVAAVADTCATAHLQRWLSHIEWPADTTELPCPIPDRAARQVDVNEEGHGETFLAKLGRKVPWDSRFETRLLRILNDSSLVATFQEQPVRVPYLWGGHTRSYYPDVAARLHDGRTMLIEVKPIYEVAYAVNQDKFDAGRAFAHSRGWGWLVWTDRRSIPELMQRDVDPALAQRITAEVMAGGLDWSAMRRFDVQGLQLLDLITLTLSHRWRWEREPFRLTATRSGDSVSGEPGGSSAAAPPSPARFRHVP